eukprot:scaffold42088_cov17-Tisochrysis_lutea.AAC.2
MSVLKWKYLSASVNEQPLVCGSCMLMCHAAIKAEPKLREERTLQDFAGEKRAARLAGSERRAVVDQASGMEVCRVHMHTNFCTHPSAQTILGLAGSMQRHAGAPNTRLDKQVCGFANWPS